jgi:hypothetical protein
MKTIRLPSMDACLFSGPLAGFNYFATKEIVNSRIQALTSSGTLSLLEFILGGTR